MRGVRLDGIKAHICVCVDVAYVYETSASIAGNYI
jgi:hypothetical protein